MNPDEFDEFQYGYGQIDMTRFYYVSNGFGSYSEFFYDYTGTLRKHQRKTLWTDYLILKTFPQQLIQTQDYLLHTNPLTLQGERIGRQSKS